MQHLLPQQLEKALEKRNNILEASDNITMTPFVESQVLNPIVPGRFQKFSLFSTTFL